MRSETLDVRRETGDVRSETLDEKAGACLSFREQDPAAFAGSKQRGISIWYLKSQDLLTADKVT